MSDKSKDNDSQYLAADGYRHELIPVVETQVDEPLKPKIEDLAIDKDSDPASILNLILANAELSKFPDNRWRGLAENSATVLERDRITGSNTPVEVLQNMVLHSEAKMKVDNGVDIKDFYKRMGALWAARAFSSAPETKK